MHYESSTIEVTKNKRNSDFVEMWIKNEKPLRFWLTFFFE
jgi:hypothetical protein